LAYYGFLALFPLLLVLATVVKLVLRGDGELQRKILQAATDYFPVIGTDLTRNVHSLGSTGIALAIGILLTFFGARGVADIFRGSVNHVWQIPYVRRPGFPVGIIKSLGIIVIGGVGLIGAPVLSGYAVSFSHALPFRLLGLLLSASILFCVFLFLFHFALAVKRPVRDVWIGALVAAIGLLLLQSLGGYILTHQIKNWDNLYGTFAIVLGLLYWIYLQTQVMLYALEIDTVRGLGLWPRAIQSKKLTDGDRKAYRLYAHRNRYNDEEEIDVLGMKKEPSHKRS
jgi:YihY family inner membrane protein